MWPETVAPFTYHLVSLAGNDSELTKAADELYVSLEGAGKTVLYDDRDARAGEKFADADLIGIPYRIVVGKETASTGQFEVVDRKTGEVTKQSREELLAR